jgi:hypothetical protein
MENTCSFPLKGREACGSLALTEVEICWRLQELQVTMMWLERWYGVISLDVDGDGLRLSAFPLYLACEVAADLT